MNCTDVFTTGVDASGTVSCAALTATGTVAGAALSSTGAVSGSSLSISGAASVGLLSSATGITGSTLTINNTADAGNFTTVGDVSTGALTASGAATAASFAATGALTGATLTITGAASTGPLDCESLDCTFTATSGGVSTGSVVCGDVTSSGTVSAPQLFASNTLIVTNTSDFSDDLFLTKNWAGWSKLQISNNSAASDSGPELRLLGNQSARVFLERDGGTHQCELIMINDEALVQTKSLSTQLSLTTNQRNPGCLVIAGNTGNVVCNTSFTNLSDSRVKTEMAEADVAELQQLFDSVEAKQYKRPDMNEDLRLGFASNDFTGAKWKNLTGTARQGLPGQCARASRPGWTRWKPGRPSGGRRIHKKHGRRPQANHQGRLRGSPHRFRQHSADAAAGPGARPQHLQRGGEGVSGRPPGEPGYNSFVPLEPMNQLQVDLADMKAFGGKPYPFMLVAIDALTKKVAAEPLKDRLASTTAAGMKKVFQALGVPANVYSDDGTEFKREFKELMDFWDIEKQVTRGHAYFAERTIRTIKEAMLRRIAAGAGRRGQWHLMLADILSQINGRKHATTQVAPNLAYSDPETAEIALRNIERRAKHKVTRPEIKVGDMVRIRVKPIESRGSYRVNEIAWSEKVYRVVSAESGEMGARFGLEGWPEKVVHRDLRKVPENSAPEPRGLGVHPASGGYREAQAPTSFLTVPLRLYNVSDSSACHSLMSSSSSGRGGGLGDPPTSQSIHSTSHAALASNQRRASSARWARVAWP